MRRDNLALRQPSRLALAAYHRRRERETGGGHIPRGHDGTCKIRKWATSSVLSREARTERGIAT